MAAFQFLVRKADYRVSATIVQPVFTVCVLADPDREMQQGTLDL